MKPPDGDTDSRPQADDDKHARRGHDRNGGQ